MPSAVRFAQALRALLGVFGEGVPQGREGSALTKPTSVALAATFFVHHGGFTAFGAQVTDAHPSLALITSSSMV